MKSKNMRTPFTRPKDLPESLIKIIRSNKPLAEIAADMSNYYNHHVVMTYYEFDEKEQKMLNKNIPAFDEKIYDELQTVDENIDEIDIYTIFLAHEWMLLCNTSFAEEIKKILDHAILAFLLKNMKDPNLKERLMTMLSPKPKDSLPDPLEAVFEKTKSIFDKIHANQDKVESIFEKLLSENRKYLDEIQKEIDDPKNSSQIEKLNQKKETFINAKTILEKAERKNALPKLKAISDHNTLFSSYTNDIKFSTLHRGSLCDRFLSFLIAPFKASWSKYRYNTAHFWKPHHWQVMKKQETTGAALADLAPQLNELSPSK